MFSGLPSFLSHDLAWLIIVPKRVEFSQPSFHFGERVKFCQGQGKDRSWETGRIIGIKFSQQETWIYSIELDQDSPLSACGVEELTAKELELKLVRDSSSLRERIRFNQQWFHTTQAAAMLGVSEEQLRKLRRNGLFKSNYHYRDTSVPGAGRPYWQWHVERCAEALEAPAKKCHTARVKK